MITNRAAASVIPVLVLAGAVLGLTRFLRAQTPGQPAQASSLQQATINTYCVGCHNNRAKTGGLSLEGKSPDVSADPETWEKVVKKLQLGVMPPVGSPRPSPEAYAALLRDLIARLDAVSAKVAPSACAAAYERTVDIDRSLLAAGREVYLNLGEGTPVTTVERRSGNGMRAMLEGPVREAAVVCVNGKRAGSVWRPPYEIPVRDLLHAGQNILRVVVANLAINGLAKGPPADYRELTARFGERFQPQDMANLQPLPSGLLGPIHLIPR